VTATTVATPSVSASSTAVVNLYPNITSWSPNPITTTSFPLVLTGVGFRQGAVIKLNGANLATTWVSTTQVRANGTAAASATSIPVVVTNPDGVASNTAYLKATIPTVTPVSVSISPATVTLKANATQLFTASVSGSTNKAVTWKVNGVVGGTWTYGKISTGGSYKVPSTVPNGGLAVTITATSVADTTKSASAKVTLTQ